MAGSSSSSSYITCTDDGADPFGFGAYNCNCGVLHDFGVLYVTFCCGIVNNANRSFSAWALMSFVILFRNATLTLFRLLPIHMPLIFLAFAFHRVGGSGISLVTNCRCISWSFVFLSGVRRLL